MSLILNIVLNVLFMKLISVDTATNLYKIVFTQKQSIQFVEYEVEVPLLREFTLCFWVKPFDLKKDQPFFNYLVGDSDRPISLWLESGGGLLKTRFRNKITTVAVDWKEDNWEHICLTWNSNLGIWTIYSGDKVLMCDASDSALKRPIAGGGRLILGYGPTERGIRYGLRGELYGFNMVMHSTLGKSDNIYIKTKKSKDLVQTTRPITYKKVILDHLLPEESKPWFYSKAPKKKTIDSNLREVDYVDDFEMELPKQTKQSSKHVDSFEMFETIPLDFTLPSISSVDKNYAETFHTLKNLTLLWKIINDIGDLKNLANSQNIREQSFSETSPSAITIAELETPPLISSSSSYDFNNQPQALSEPNFNVNNGMLPNMQISKPFNTQNSIMHSSNSRNNLPDLVDYEVPPPPQKNDMVFGHWSSGSFPSLVYDFLKQNKNALKQQMNPDSYPYASEHLNVYVSPPKLDFNNHYEKISKRDTRGKEYNVKILENDFRQIILDQHKNHNPKDVDIIYRGERTDSDLRNHKYTSDNAYISLQGPRPFKSTDVISDNLEKDYSVSSPEDDTYGGVRYSQNINNIPTFEQQYARSNYKGHQWHTLPHENKTLTFFNHKAKVPVELYNEAQLEENKNAAIAYEIDKLYKEDNIKSRSKQRSIQKAVLRTSLAKEASPAFTNTKDTFRKQVKLGNTLNEKTVLGDNRAQSFVGGDDNVPELTRYRSDLDNVDLTTPPSLKPRACEELSSIQSNIQAMQFIRKSYKKCTLDMSLSVPSSVLLVNWRKTPMRLFGGLKAVEARAFCGNF